MTHEEVLARLKTGTKDTVSVGAINIAVEAVEKQIPQQVIEKYSCDCFGVINEWHCPSCEHEIYGDEEYCPNCGQHLLWE